MCGFLTKIKDLQCGYPAKLFSFRNIKYIIFYIYNILIYARVRLL